MPLIPPGRDRWASESEASLVYRASSKSGPHSETKTPNQVIKPKATMPASGVALHFTIRFAEWLERGISLSRVLC